MRSSNSLFPSPYTPALPYLKLSVFTWDTIAPGPISNLRSLDILLIRLSYTGYNVALKDFSNRSSLV